MPDILLSQLLQELPDARISGPVEVPIAKVECDSRRIGEGDLFVAIRGGQEQDRHLFVGDALARGARGVVVEEEVDCGRATRIVVGNCRAALARLAARYYDDPGQKLQLIGVTGTNGKTSTALLMRQVVAAAGRPCGYLGTLGRIVGEELEELGNTTPEANDLHRHLRSMVEQGKEAAVLEVSSHGLALERVAGICFQAAIFTNLTRDHLDFHRSEEDYFRAKARLFEELDGETGGKGIVNIDDPAGKRLIDLTAAPVTTYGWGGDAAVRLVEMTHRDTGMRLRLQILREEMVVDTRLMGRFNSYNIAAAIATGLALGLSSERICEGVAEVEQIPGRFERITEGQDFQVVVDYAHTPDGLDTVLGTARELTRGRLICVFGCGGDRDRGKRPQMGRVVEERADLGFVTSDNPRSEEPEKIIEEILAGMGAAGRRRVYPDRYQAIREALRVAESGDVVVIAGKGHEGVQILADRSIPFDDREVARRALREMAAGEGGA